MILPECILLWWAKVQGVSAKDEGSRFVAIFASAPAEPRGAQKFSDQKNDKIAFDTASQCFLGAPTTDALYRPYTS